MTNTILIGIDYSITSPAITIQKDNEIIFLIFPKNGDLKSSLQQNLEQTNIQINPVPVVEQLPKKSSIALTERRAMFDAVQQIDIIINTIKQFVQPENAVVGIEGLSFASTSSRLSQISGYQWILRYKLIEMGIKLDNIWIFAPNNVKSTAGKGNFKKEEMIQAFLDNISDTNLTNTEFFKKLKEESASFQTKTGKWLKPIDDVCDSYWIMKTLEKNIKN